MFTANRYGATLDQLIEVCAKHAQDQKRKDSDRESYVKRKRASGWTTGRRK